MLACFFTLPSSAKKCTNIIASVLIPPKTKNYPLAIRTRTKTATNHLGKRKHPMPHTRIAFQKGPALRDVLLRKKCFLLDFVQMRGGMALANSFGTFSRGAFLVNKGGCFFQNVNNLNFKLFLS